MQINKSYIIVSSDMNDREIEEQLLGNMTTLGVAFMFDTQENAIKWKDYSSQCDKSDLIKKCKITVEVIE